MNLDTTCVGCGEQKPCLLIEASVPDRVEGDEVVFELAERVLVCRDCLEDDGGVLGGFIHESTSE